MLRYLAGVLCLAACSHHPAADSAVVRQAAVISQPHITVVTDDHPVQGGVMLLAPAITAADGGVIARASRHGSQCETDVRGSVSLTGTRLDVHIRYVPRPGVMCSQIARVLEYTATVSEVPPGTYDVHLYQTDDSGPDHEVQSQRVTVR